MPHCMPISHGQRVRTTAYVNASWCKKRIRWSHTRYILFLHHAPIVWYSKKQQTMETSAFLAEYIATRIFSTMGAYCLYVFLLGFKHCVYFCFHAQYMPEVMSRSSYALHCVIMPCCCMRRLTVRIIAAFSWIVDFLCPFLHTSFFAGSPLSSIMTSSNNELKQ
jgi:hypothetical protein